MKNLPILLIVMFVFSACSPATTIPVATISPSSTPTFSPTATETLQPTVVPTLTLSPDLNKYECADSVAKEDCDFIKEGVRIARYSFLNIFGIDMKEGVKFLIINDPLDFRYAEGGTPGVFIVPEEGEPFVWINTAHPLWAEYTSPEYRFKHVSSVAHEFFHAWQWQHGCLTNNSPIQPTSFMNEGYARYVDKITAGVDFSDRLFSDEFALSFWQATEWNENEWFRNGDVTLVVVKHLVEQFGIQPYLKFCEDFSQGMPSSDAFQSAYDNLFSTDQVPPNDAFQSAYGVSISEFRAKFKGEILGSLKDCTVATCGAGVDNYSDKYKLGHLLDRTRTTPNLIARFVDQNNEPVILSHVSMLKQNEGTTGEYAQPFIVPGTFSQAMQPGRYSFFFCEPEYPTDQNDGKCQYHETDWFDVSNDQPTEITFLIPLPIKNPNLSSPNLIVKFLDKDGNPLPNLELQICSYEFQVKICSPSGSGSDWKTDSNGVFRDFLRSGKYLIRILAAGIEFGTELRDIIVNETGITETSYQFPVPNLIVKFTDANGGLVPDHGFVLCKVVEGVGDCNSSAYIQGRWGYTSEKGIFETLVEPGEYYILTCKIDCSGYPFDYTIKDVIVASPTEVTTVEYQLYK